MWCKPLILALVICLTPAALWAGPFEDGLAAYDSGDFPAAIRRFRLAADQGTPEAQNNLGLMYVRGQGVSQDYGEAARWYRLAADQGYAPAQGSLGAMYNLGHGVPRDYGEAVRWFHLAADQGYDLAQCGLGDLYLKGQGVPQDFREATRWYRLAADQGGVCGQGSLGDMYREGHGVPQDYGEAARWYRLAAEQGMPEAQYNLGVMYDNGKGVPQDFVQAHTWYNLAAAQGLKPAAENRDKLSRQMTAAQIAEAQRLAQQWRPRQQRSGGSAAAAVPPLSTTPQAGPKSSGSGFVVSAEGHLLTNQHVVDSCTRLTVQAAKGRRPAILVRADARNDLALLRMQDKTPAQAKFRDGRGIRAGDSVIVLGYPLTGLLASGANVTTGTVSALSGPGDDSRLMQISAPVQPGNSGGPILDSSGNIVGIVVSKLDALKVATAIGDIPQNVNFGIHASVARSFLDANGVDYKTAPAKRTLDSATIAAEAKAYTVLVECW